jgi:excisionase family DNA binding protein
MGKQILVADEVAELLRVDRQRVYELARRNAIPVIRLGERQYRFDAEAIRQWLMRGGGTAEGGGGDESRKSRE